MPCKVSHMRFHSSSANCMDHFDVIAILHQVLPMHALGHDLVIDFHRDCVSGIATRIEQGSDTDGPGKFVRHAIQLDLHHALSLAAAAACRAKYEKPSARSGRALGLSSVEWGQRPPCCLSSSFFLSFGGGLG